MKRYRHGHLADVVSYAFLIVMAAFATAPLIWQFLTSFKTLPDIMQNTVSLFPKEFTIDNYKIVLTVVGFPRFLLNSLFVSLFATTAGMVLSCLCSYAIVRFFPNVARRITQFLIVSYLFPAILLVVPYFILLSAVHFSNRLSGLVLVYLSFSIPYCTWMLTGYFATLPASIEEAARIDGASQFQTFYRISLPLVAPGIVATFIFAFINAWNEFLYSLVLISSGTKKTVSVALYSLTGGETLRYGEMMAASVLVVLPSLLLFFLIQKRLVGGLTGGAVK